jgi:hypothetical protein
MHLMHQYNSNVLCTFTDELQFIDYNISLFQSNNYQVYFAQNQGQNQQVEQGVYL